MRYRRSDLDAWAQTRRAVDARIAEGTDISLSRLAAPASRRIGLAWRRTSLRADEFRLFAHTLRELSEVA